MTLSALLHLLRSSISTSESIKSLHHICLANAYSNMHITTGSSQSAFAMGFEVGRVNRVVVVVPGDEQRSGLHCAESCWLEARRG